MSEAAEIFTASAAVIVPVMTAATVYLRLAMRAESLQTRITIMSEVKREYVRREACKLLKLLGACDDSSANDFANPDS